MPENAIPNTLPDCELIRLIAEKANQRRDTDFNFLARLDDFRRRVSDEVRQINVLFPEYTPHDEQYHLKKLFYVADTVLGRSRFEEMNSAELFVLAVALYGHDWGMAINNVEKEFILAGKLPKGVNADELWVLPDERQRIAEFARNERLTTDSDGHIKDVTIEQWREYVRQTHAFRSGERVRKYFESIDGGVAEAASRVCIGHWLDFEDLQDYHAYPPNFAVMSESVNLRALAVYLRLIDLLDLGEDRTPYIIWKFVAPRDPRSKMAWSKHRALRPITCQPYQQGRIIQVDGSTDDHEVYAALEDLHRWCDQQLRGCSDLLARMNDPRHKLDLYHIDWRVAARGFKPISIQFEFDRSKMFEILSDEIYQGDPYVFVRELLQNSIDAIRLRREILERAGIAPVNIGIIRVNVEHGDGGDAVITWSDDGIGMDDYVVRNYLAIAGKSYYRSVDFERLGLNMDPISNFGVGLLSCFMVAQRIQIETFKDPYMPPIAEPLKINIPEVGRQFRIEVGPREAAKFGTTITVFVEGKKLPVDEKKNHPSVLDITAYLMIIAGFVEFPIVVTERGHKTVILDPKQDVAEARHKFGGDFHVHQIDLDYPLSKVVLPQDLSTARELLKEESWQISEDLGLEGFQGAVTYLLPKEEFTTIQLPPYRSGIEIEIRREHNFESFELRSNDEYHDTRSEICRSAKLGIREQVYRDGILVSEAGDHDSFRYSLFERQWVPQPRVVVNIPKTSTPNVDLSRTRFLRESANWKVPIQDAILDRLEKMKITELLALPPLERFYQLGRLASNYNVSSEEMSKIYPRDLWPLLCLCPNGGLKAIEWRELDRIAVYLLPDALKYVVGKLVDQRYASITPDEVKLVHWIGQQCVIDFAETNRFPLQTSIGYTRFLMMRAGIIETVRFLDPPWEGSLPLLQEIWSPGVIPELDVKDENFLERIARSGSPLSWQECNSIRESAFEYDFPRVAKFSAPFQNSFAFGLEILNVEHRVTQMVFKIFARGLLGRASGGLTEAQLGSLSDRREFAFDSSYLRYPSLGQDKFIANQRAFWSLAQNLGILVDGGVEDYVPSFEEFVPGSVDAGQRSLELMGSNYPPRREFGKPLG